jgi:S1-C subfamily serine protease
MRRWSWGLLALLVLAAPVRAAQPRCPLPLGECMAQFGAMRDRPWLGVEVETDSVTGARVVHAVVPGGPAARAGVKPGDTLRKLGGVAPQLWFAGKAGWKSDWKDGQAVAITVERAGHERALQMPLAHISEETLAEIIGVHVLEGHLAYTEGSQAHEDH